MPTGKSKSAASKDSTPRNLVPLLILEVLRARAGANGLSQKEIQSFLKADFGISIERHGVKRNLALLQTAGDENPALGFRLHSEEISPMATGQNRGAATETRWFIEKEESPFDPSEIRCLVDIVQTFELMSNNQRGELIEKLCELSDEPITVPQFDRGLSNPVVNKQMFLTISVLADALQTGKAVQFNYGFYDTDFKLHLYGETSPVVHRLTPVQMLVSDGHYYLVGKYEEQGDCYHFRIDRIANAELIEAGLENLETKVETRKGAGAKVQDPQKYSSLHAFMQADKPEKIKFRILLSCVQYVFDRFGRDVSFSNRTKNTVDVTVKTSPKAVLFWALQFANVAEVLEPQSLRDDIAATVKNLSKKYC